MEYGFKKPKYSGWVCYLFGNTPEIDNGITWLPSKEQVPNTFIRFMMKVCLGCTWVKYEEN